MSYFALPLVQSVLYLCGEVPNFGHRASREVHLGNTSWYRGRLPLRIHAEKVNPVASSGNAEPSQRTQSGGSALPRSVGLKVRANPQETGLSTIGPKAKGREDNGKRRWMVSNVMLHTFTLFLCWAE